MLKYFLTSLALTVGLAHPSIASESKIIKTDLVCINIVKLDEVLTKYGEEAALTMVSVRDTKKGVSANPMVFFMNPETKSWTLVEQFSEKEYCVVAVGSNVKPYIEEEEKEVKKQNHKNPKVM